MKNNIRKSLTLICALYTFSAFGQELTQNIRGTITDIDSRAPLIGATVKISGTNPILGTSSDLDGNFKIEGVTIGRVNIEVTYVGYEPKTLSNIQVNSAKEVLLNIALSEQINKLQEVTIKANADRSESINEMAIISARSLSEEEAKRYAGSFNDPSRMAANFAGVNADASGDNSIVVRGNSPKGILWRVEGVEAPNPNHFADEGSSGGSINALNSKVVGNSEFLTGAFAPEYGNATSGVFDIKLREGNNEQREYTFGFGILGADITLEGPFKQGGKSSYLANYRYSSLALLDNAGIIDFGGVPKYQDGAINIKFPTQKMGNFKLFGFGGISNIQDQWSDTIEGSVAEYKDNFGTQMGLLGFENTYLINNQSYVKSSISVSNNGSYYTIGLKDSTAHFNTTDEYSLNKTAVRFASTFHQKVNAKNNIGFGAIYSIMDYSFVSGELNDNHVFENYLDTKDRSGYLQLHGTWKHRFTEELSLVSGMHFLQFSLNNTFSIEPRVGVRYQVAKNQIVTAGFGVHSKIESLLYYTVKVQNEAGVLEQPNTNIELPKARHYVLGYDYFFTKNMHVKTELYYQELYDVPVGADPMSKYSLINQSDWFDRVALNSNGKGKNYGVEITIERFFAHNFYYLITGSLYESLYQTQDKVWRNSRFNGNYNSNFLIGKEFKVGAKEKDKTLLASIKATVQGGNRYTPIDLEASKLSQTAVRVNEPFSAKADEVFVLNIAASYRVNRQKVSHELKLEIINATNNQARINEYYNPVTQAIEYDTQLELIPNLMYSINF